MPEQQVALVSTIEGDHFVRLFDSEAVATEWASAWIIADDGPLARNPSDRKRLAQVGQSERLFHFQDWLGASEWLCVMLATANPPQ